MTVLVAGATGAIGRQLVPRLVASGHDVVGMTRSASKRDLVRALGARPVVVDALDPDSVARAVGEAEPQVIVHQLTALAGALDVRHFDRAFALTNRLRTEGTDHLLAAGRAVGIRRFVAQSFGACPYARSGGKVKTEDDPLDPAPPEGMRQTLEAIRYLEDAVTGGDWVEGIVLRYGAFYGPGTSLGAAVARAAARGRGRHRHDDRGARSLEREGKGRAGLAAKAPELARGLRRGCVSAPHEDLLDELRPVRSCDRLPDARQRGGGGGRRS